MSTMRTDATNMGERKEENTGTHRRRYASRDEVNNRYYFAASASDEALFREFFSSWNGLEIESVETAKMRFGSNVVTHGKRDSLIRRLAKAFPSP